MRQHGTCCADVPAKDVGIDGKQAGWFGVLLCWWYGIAAVTSAAICAAMWGCRAYMAGVRG
jgi:hypothetical protein